ncbi:UPF0389 protein CG9231 [Folsomia candida]|uniref:Uncharacterized protein n=1 Tax=Folsomia candida TaxID=158441 RepID=A0A226E3U5_FOLCA|nr:UPF0389 protein CG9231 [Folsomia candida]OXA51166.1 hypothetical protein Fcan01_14040 [Folsomia candida]
MNFLTINPSKKPIAVTRHLIGGTFLQPIRTLGQTASATASCSPAYSGPFSLGPPKPKLIPTTLDRVFLRWSGHYVEGDAIPRLIDGNVIHRARSLAIVRMNLIFMFAAVVASGAMVMSGKAAAERGESLQQQNLDWHKHINDTHKWSQEATMPY